MEVYRGDIFWVGGWHKNYGSEQESSRPAIVVSNNKCNEHSTVIEVVYLTTQKKEKRLPTHVDVISSVPSTALCEQVYSISKERLQEFVRTCTDEEMEAIDRALMVSLGLTECSNDNAGTNPDPTATAANSMIDDLRMKLEGAERELDEKNAMLAEVQLRLSDADKRIQFLQEQNEEVHHNITERTVIELTTERDLYKQQYEMLLERLIAR